MYIRQLFAILGFVALCHPAYSQPVVKDSGVGITRDEFVNMVENWPPNVRAAAANDTGDRLELINIALSNKKMFAEALSLTPEQNEEMYWALQSVMQRAVRIEYMKMMLEELEVPDMAALAAERYETDKEKYAKIREQRLSSHILLSCPTGGCDERPKYRELAKDLLAKLHDGADFEALVVEYSGDPGSKNNGGKFDRWMTLGDTSVSPPYSEGVFAIDEVGGYTTAETQFGVHIIRLDGVRPETYAPFEKVKAAIVADLESQYRKLAAKEFEARFRITDDIYIDGKAMEEIFAPYKTVP